MDTVGLSTLLLAAASLILCFAFIYWHWNGVRFANSQSRAGFGDCIYMSVVTFTSLGYGDIVPVGYAKPLACLEVFLGLSLFGIGIAKLTSSTQSYYLGQLYAREAQERFETFLVELRKVREQYKDVATRQRRQEPCVRSLGSLHVEAQKLFGRIRDYTSFEINQGDLLRRMPIGPIAHVLRTCAQIAPLIATTATFPRSLHSQRQRRMARELVEKAHTFAIQVSDSCDDKAVLSEAVNLKARCAKAAATISAAHDEVSARFKKASPTDGGQNSTQGGR